MTEQYRDALFLDEEWTTISESGRAQDEADQVLIQSHPSIFQSFYALPSQTSRPELRRLRDFLYAGGIRCGTLLYSLHLHTGNLLDVFQRWELAVGPRSEDWYYTVEFGISLADFAERQYGDFDLATRVAADFYGRVFACASEGHDQALCTDDHADRLFLDDGVRLIECAGNLHALLRSFRTTGLRPSDAELQRPATAVIRHLPTGSGTEIFEFPPATTELLRQAKSGVAIREVIADFQQRQIDVEGFTCGQMIFAAIGMLEARKLLVLRPALCESKEHPAI